MRRTKLSRLSFYIFLFVLGPFTGYAGSGEPLRREPASNASQAREAGDTARAAVATTSPASPTATPQMQITAEIRAASIAAQMIAQTNRLLADCEQLLKEGASAGKDQQGVDQPAVTGDQIRRALGDENFLTLQAKITAKAGSSSKKK